MYEPITASSREPHYLQMSAEVLPAIPRQPLQVVLDNIRSAFNVGSIFRTSDAGAIAHMHLCGMTAYPPNKKLEKTALGAFDYVPWTYHATTADALERLRGEGVVCVAVEALDSAVPHSAFPWPRGSAIVFGNEVTGISPEVLSLCDATVRIPMRGYKNTINVATAFGVVMYEILRQWESGTPEAGD
ncbi:MAG TPA: RNA methyltransferase [Candidatus Hydrogenedentes bacterium]|nr:RNA methyltransferase [Candidatus Hydrogenedentota bacterium]